MLAAFGLAACGGGGGGTASTTPVTMPDDGMDGTDDTMEPTVSSALETATELASRLDGMEMQLDQAVEDAIKYSGMLGADAVGGNSATAAENAGKVLAANTKVQDADTMADAVITAADAVDVDSIEDASEKAAVMVLLTTARDAANDLKAKVKEINDATDDTDATATLAEAVAVVEGDDADMPRGAEDIGNNVASAIDDAFTNATPRIEQGATAPATDVMNTTDENNAVGISWHEALGKTPSTQAQIVSGAITMVDAVSITGLTVDSADADLIGTTPSGTTNAGNTNGTATYKGIAGSLLCTGADCGVDDDESRRSRAPGISYLRTRW